MLADDDDDDDDDDTDNDKDDDDTDDDGKVENQISIHNLDQILSLRYLQHGLNQDEGQANPIFGVILVMMMMTMTMIVIVIVTMMI